VDAASASEANVPASVLVITMVFVITKKTYSAAVYQPRGVSETSAEELVSAMVQVVLASTVGAMFMRRRVCESRHLPLDGHLGFPLMPLENLFSFLP
jgi:hypothetical protein